jgi:hypothetical protein
MDTTAPVRTIAIYDSQACICRIVPTVAHERASELLDGLNSRISSRAWQTDVIAMATQSEYAVRWTGPFGLVVVARIADYRVAEAVLVHDSEPGACQMLERLVKRAVRESQLGSGARTRLDRAAG